MPLPLGQSGVGRWDRQALDGFRPASNLRTPLSVTWILGILANLRVKYVHGFGVLGGKVLTELLV